MRHNQRAAARKVSDPFRYGWREVPRQRPDGSWDYDQVPLTLEDALHPQLGDVMPQASVHELDVAYLRDVAQLRVANDPSALVAHDLQIVWEDSVGLRPHSPDVTVIFGVRDARTRIWTNFNVAEEGVRPRMIVEVVSPAYRKNDIVTKVEHYHQARVPFYYIVDRKVEEGPVKVLGYHYKRSGFVPLTADADDWLWVEPLALWLAPKDNRVVCYDGDTEQEIGDYTAVAARLEAESQARQRAEQRANHLAGELEQAKTRLRQLENGSRPGHKPRKRKKP
jgi:Uma2 family endonuclease